MGINVPGVPSSVLLPGVYAFLNFNNLSDVSASKLNNMLIIGQRLNAYVTPARWQDGTLHDATAQGTYTGTTVKKFLLVILTVATPDTFHYSLDGGDSFSSPIDIAVGAIVLESGVTITFAATTGHAAGDSWKFEAYPAGTVAKETPTQVSNLDKLAQETGYGSIAHRMGMAAFGNNNFVDMSYATLDDNGSSKAAGSFTIGGAADNTGEEVFRIGGDRFSVSVTKADTPAEVAILLQNKIAEIQESMQIVQEVDVTTQEKVNVTAKNAGTLGNLIGLEYVGGNTGLTVTVVQMTGGASDPSFTALLTALAGNRYYYWANPYLDSTILSAIKVHQDTEEGPLTMNPFFYFTGETADETAAETKAAADNNLRSNIMTVQGNNEPPYEYVASMIAELTLHEDPAEPVNQMPLRNMSVPPPASRFSFLTKNRLLGSGVMPLVVNDDGYLSVSRLVSTSQDPNKREINTARVGDWVADRIVTRLKKKFKNAKNLPRTVREVKSEVIASLLLEEDLEIIQPGSTEANKALIAAEIDANDPNRINVVAPIYAVGGAHVFALNLGVRIN